MKRSCGRYSTVWLSKPGEAVNTTKKNGVATLVDDTGRLGVFHHSRKKTLLKKVERE